MAKALGLALAAGLPTLLLAAGHPTTEEQLLSDVESLKQRLDEMMSHENRLTRLEKKVNVTQGCRNASPWSPICGLGMALERSEEPLRGIFLNDFMLVAGVLMVLQFHLAKFAPKRWAHIMIREKGKVGAVRLLGRNIVILELYYAELWWFGHVLENPFYCSLGFMLLDVVILYFGSESVAQLCGIERPSNTGKEDERCIRTRYTDWSHTTGHVTAVFLSQICLFMLFVMYLNEDPDTHDSKNVVIVQWLVGVVVTNIAGNEETGVGYQWSVWARIRDEWDSVQEEPKVKQPKPWKILVRQIYDMVINAFCREVLLGLAPVVLATSDRWDFIKDCLAIFFISRLDDLDDFKTLEYCTKAYGELDADSDNADAKKSPEDVEEGAHVPLTQLSHTAAESQ